TCWGWAFRRSRSIHAGTGRAASTRASLKAWLRCRSSVPELDPYAGLSAVLGVAPVHVDPQRQTRKGVPEIVYAAAKAPPVPLAAVQQLLDGSPTGRVLVSRATRETVTYLRAALEPGGASMLVSGETVLVVRAGASPLAETGGVVAVLTAGASDA